MEDGIYKKRLYWVDGLKGFAIIAVVLGHVLLGFIENKTFTEHYNTLLRLKEWIYSWHMPLFMWVSGYTYAMSCYKNGCIDKSKVKSKVINLILLYIIFQVTLVVLKLLLSNFVDNKLSLKTALYNIFLPDTLMWYIYVLVIYYILFSILLRKRRISHILIFCFLMFIAIIAYSLSNSLKLNLSVYNFMYCSPFFFSGILSKRFDFERLYIHLNKYFILCMGYSLLFIVYTSTSFTFWQENRMVICILNILNAFSIITVLSGVFVKIRHKNCLTKLGRKSLVIYFLHTYFVTGIKNIVIRTGFNSIILAIFFGCFISLSITYAIAVFSDKNKYLGYIFNPINFFKK